MTSFDTIRAALEHAQNEVVGYTECAACKDAHDANGYWWGPSSDHDEDCPLRPFEDALAELDRLEWENQFAIAHEERDKMQQLIDSRLGPTWAQFDALYDEIESLRVALAAEPATPHDDACWIACPHDTPPAVPQPGSEDKT